VAPAQFVGFYAGAERIIKALQTMAEPISQAMFPQSSSMADQDRSKLARIVTATSVAMTAAGLIGAILLYALAPLIIRIMLGPGYDPAVDVLRILAILLPVMGISMPLVMQWMIPLGMDRQLMWIAIGAGVFHIPLAIFLASRFQHVGVASAYAITEVGHTIALLVMLQTRRLIPFTVRWRGHSPIGAQQES
jgi:polysaccharide transporter, PST family